MIAILPRNIRGVCEEVPNAFYHTSIGVFRIWGMCPMLLLCPVLRNAESMTYRRLAIRDWRLKHSLIANLQPQFCKLSNFRC